MKLKLFFLLFCISINLFAERGRVQKAHGTVVTDMGTNLRGAIISTDWNTSYNLPADCKQKIFAAANTYGLNTVHLYLEKYDSPTGCNVQSADSIVEWTSQANMYLVITIGCGSNNGSFNLSQAKAFWNFYAGRYANRTHVVYEIHNEPIFACNGNGTSREDLAVVDLESQCYNIIRSKAPNTHVILYSNGGLSHTDQIQGMINGMQNAGISFANASIGYHGYYWCVNARDGMGYDNNTEALALDPLIAAGYSFISTEFDVDATLSGDDTKNGQLLKFYEQRNTSWLSFFDIAASTTPASLDSRFITGVNNMGLTWTPDNGTWPGNGGGTTYPVITAQGENLPDEGKEKAFDGNNNTKWFDYSATTWIQIQYSAAAVYNTYSIVSGNDEPTRDPKAWTLQGSNNGSTWTTLNSQTNQTWTARNQAKAFTFTNSTAYSYYKLNITANNGSASTQLSEIILSASGTDTQSPSVPAGLNASSITATSFTLSWSASTDNVGVTSYEVWRAAAIVGTTASTSLNITGLSCGSVNAMTVKAKDAAGNISAASSTYNVTTSPCGGGGLAGTAYRWSKNTTATSNSNRVAAAELIDGNTTTDVALNGGANDINNAYEAAGLVFSTATTVTAFEFINGFYGGSYDNGSFDSGIAIQTTTNGTTWKNATGWSISPAYLYCNTAISGTKYTFTGNATDIKGIRVVGKVHSSTTTGSWEARAREISAYSNLSKSAEIFKISQYNEPLYTNNVNLFPNPANTVINLNFEKQVNNTDLSIFNLEGRVLIKKSFLNSKSLNVDIKDLLNGIYFIKIDTGKNIQIKKFIKE